MSGRKAAKREIHRARSALAPGHGPGISGPGAGATSGDTPARPVLLLGIGNPGRFDDGLGPTLAEEVESLEIPVVTVGADYQLTVEDSAQVAEHEVVIFADADAVGPAPFSFRAIGPLGGLGFSSHGIEPGNVLALAADLFGVRPEAYLLSIRGHEFGQRDHGQIELGVGLTPAARQHLVAALAFLTPLLRSGAFREAAAAERERRSQT